MASDREDERSGEAPEGARRAGSSRRREPAGSSQSAGRPRSAGDPGEAARRGTVGRASAAGPGRHPSPPTRLRSEEEEGPSFFGMIALVAVLVATVILVFFGLGYAFGRVFL
jgi:hypothetical protein